MRILLIEDTELKRQRVSHFLAAAYATAELKVAKSSDAGRKAAEAWHPDLIILDMSLPVFDFETVEAGYTHLSYGGVDVLEHLEQCRLGAVVIVLTSFIRFGKDENARTLQQLDSELQADYPARYKGHVSYSTVSDSWQKELRDLIERSFPQLTDRQL